jgi:hypothetical protein
MIEKWKILQSSTYIPQTGRTCAGNAVTGTRNVTSQHLLLLSLQKAVLQSKLEPVLLLYSDSS